MKIKEVKAPPPRPHGYTPPVYKPTQNALRSYISPGLNKGFYDVGVSPRVFNSWKLGWYYTRRFATTIFSATQRCNIVATLFRMLTTLFQHCNDVLRKKSSRRIVLCNITFSCCGVMWVLFNAFSVICWLHPSSTTKKLPQKEKINVHTH